MINPFAEQLTFLSDKTRTRRDHMKYLTLIQAIALLHQYQRQVKRVEHRGQWLEYIEVTPTDIALANRLAHEVLGRTLDEMPPQTRKLLILLKEWVQETAQQQAIKSQELHFTRRDIRTSLGWGDTQLKIHLSRLLEMEYLVLYRRGLTYEYTLLWDGGSGEESHLCGLLDVAAAETPATVDKGSVLRSDITGDQSASGRHRVGSQSESLKPAPGYAAQGIQPTAVGVDENAVIREKKQTPLPPSPSLSAINSSS